MSICPSLALMIHVPAGHVVPFHACTPFMSLGRSVHPSFCHSDVKFCRHHHHHQEQENSRSHHHCLHSFIHLSSRSSIHSSTHPFIHLFSRAFSQLVCSYNPSVTISPCCGYFKLFSSGFALFHLIPFIHSTRGFWLCSVKESFQSVEIQSIFLFRFFMDGRILPLCWTHKSPLCIHTYTYLPTYLSIYLSTYLPTYTYLPIPTYTYLYTYIHTVIHACMHAIVRPAVGSCWFCISFVFHFFRW